jgi:hypothetical protein
MTLFSNTETSLHISREDHSRELLIGSRTSRRYAAGARVNFIHGDINNWRDVAASDSVHLSLDDLAPRIRMGREIWIIQAFYSMRQRGYEVSLSDRMQPDAINVVHRDDLQRIRTPIDAFLVTVRADRDPAFVSQFEIVQNQWSIWSPRDVYVPHWPQPGLVKRDPGRGTRVENIVFFGKEDHLARQFRSKAFREQLERRGMKLHLRSDNWWDYSDADVVIAVREGEPFYLQIKPASKLVNAWLAGCPAILGREAGYREMRRSELDYMEAVSVEGVLGAVDRLRCQPELFQQMIENGRSRAAAHDYEAVASAWEDVLFDRIQPQYSRWREQRAAVVSRRVSRIFKLVRRRMWGTQAVQEPKNPLHSFLYRLRRGVVLPRTLRSG